MSGETERARAEVTPRSRAWFGAEGRNGFIHRSWMRTQGFPADVLDGRPVIGIANSWSQLTPCNAHLRDLAQAVARGVWEAGGLPLEFPTLSTGESLMRPTAMLYRNLVAMGVEETLRANPVDGVVLLSGCDKTTPGLLMGAASVDLPTIALSGGPMLNGKFQGRDIGSGTDLWRFSEDLRAGVVTPQDFAEAEGCMSRSPGHCMSMGTASTMACLLEALGMQLAGGGTLPAVDSRRYALAQLSGRRVVQLVEEGVRLSSILTREAFENAVVVNAALGGSTNAAVHLLAFAGRLGVPLVLDDFDDLTRAIPTLVDLMPTGRFLMEDFAYAGGVQAVMARIADHLHLAAKTVSGATVADQLSEARCWNDTVIRTRTEPVTPPGTGTVVLHGNLCPDGAVLKVSAAAENLLQHRGRAVVFDTIALYTAVADDPEIDINADDVIVVRNAGPVGYPGFPEVGNVPLPRRLLEAGVRDMIRVSDARMSGTGFGTCILHVSPESAVGGPLALVRTGDIIELDVPARTLRLIVSNDELAARRAAWEPPSPTGGRGYTALYCRHVQQAHLGADFDFLVGGSGSDVPLDSH